LRVLGLDLGDRRIGVAVSDPSRLMSFPRETLFVSSQKEALGEIRRLVEEGGIDTIVIGLPLNLDGSIGPRAIRTKEFAELLKNEIDVTIEFWDERLTTKIAKRTLHDAGRTATRRDGQLDQMSAVLILQGYLDRQATSSKSREGP